MAILNDVRKYKDYLKSLFSTDQELLDKYHIYAGRGLEECVEKTISDLEKAYNFNFYKITKNNKDIGYFGTQNNGNEWLTGFFIVPEYRKKEFISEILDKQIFPKFNNFFYCGLYTKNDRAIEFIKKIGGKVIYNSEDKTILKVTKEK